VKNEILHRVKEERNVLHTNWSYVAYEVPSKTFYWREDIREDISDGKTRKET